MKKGMILFVTEGREALGTQTVLSDLEALLEDMKVDAVCLAGSEEEIVYSWWQLLTRGMQHICCIKATYRSDSRKLVPFGEPLRLCG